VFGAYRYLLAMLAIFSHFHPIYYGKLNWTGMYALFAFYVLSGYLMTRVLHETYGFSARGAGHFLWNRALRIYPMYWVAAIVSLLVVQAIPATVALYTKVLGIPLTMVGITENVFIFGLHAWQVPRLVTPAWSLHVELCFYVLMALGISRTLRTTALWFAASLAYTAYLVHSHVDFAFRYSTLLAGSLPFSVGALAYFASKRLRPPQPWAPVAVLAFLAVDFLGMWVLSDVMTEGFYLGLALNAVAVVCLAQVKARSLHPRLVKIDRLLGDLTYPMFLLHLPVAYVWTAVLHAHVRPSSNLMMLIGLPTLNLVAWCAVRLVDRQIEPSRATVRATVFGGQTVPGSAAAAR
jgi:peptidoglycan/LPS O-acetylase OafA/YrhL